MAKKIQFEDDSATIAPEQLVNGKNTVVLSEITLAGSRDYTIYMNKDYEIISIEGIEDHIFTMVDHAPNLPQEVTVTFKDGGSQAAKVNWDTVNPSFYKKPGTFTVKGQLADLKGALSTFSVNVTVDGIVSIDKLGSVTTLSGTAPKLATTVKAQYLNDTRELPLTFAELDPSLYAYRGTVIAVGKAEGYAGDILQVVEVKGKKDPRPILTAGAADRLTETTAFVSFNTSDNGWYYYQIVERGAEMPEMDTNVAGVKCKTGPVQIDLNGLKNAAAKDIYIVVKKGNVISDVLNMEIPKYTSGSKH
ncbi:Ig-like domain-containing protein [Paenibacillus sp. DMB20]|uniref:Ig-like domain-containing protein n=1 Tax=Paenibacillus sp. DMB20 TaxID=1642570 RepID=UPI000627604C|nr:Ig-like domain-containing protein [Paenibacillus sp. DMB20]KKO54003.1 hypothetical protein XI25_07640 [Paenibacillus sp. DMB20]